MQQIELMLLAARPDGRGQRQHSGKHPDEERYEQKAREHEPAEAPYATTSSTINPATRTWTP